MTESAATSDVGANVRWFAAAYAIANVAAAALASLLAHLEMSWPVGANVGVFIAIVILAGNRYARSGAAWTGQARGALALGYVVAALVVSALLAIAAVAIAAVFAADALAPIFQYAGEYAAPTLLALLFIALIFYVGARVVLRFLVRPQSPSGI